MKFIDAIEDASFEDSERDIPNQRSVFLGNGREIKLERRNPYGFVYIVWDAGSPPIALQGCYTDFDSARSALDSYVAEYTRESVSSKPTKKVEPLKYKKAYRDSKTGENITVNG